MTIQYINNCNILNMQMRIKNKLITSSPTLFSFHFFSIFLSHETHNTQTQCILLPNLPLHLRLLMCEVKILFYFILLCFYYYCCCHYYYYYCYYLIFLMGYICSFGSIFIGKIYWTNLRIAFGFIEFEFELSWALYIFGYLLWAYFFVLHGPIPLLVLC